MIASSISCICWTWESLEWHDCHCHDCDIDTYKNNVDLATGYVYLIIQFFKYEKFHE